MIRKLRYILSTMLLLTTFQVAAQYSIDKVCVGAERYYRVTGEVNSTYTWTIVDAAGLTYPQASDRDTIAILWNMAPGVYTLTVVQHGANGCDADIQLGTVEVFDPPVAFAGNDTTLCAGGVLILTDATAANYASLLWTTTGDGSFNYDTLLNATYTPGANDILAGNVMLTLTATGQGNGNTCQPAVSAINVTISTLAASAASTPVTCSGAADGSVTLTVYGGTEPYTFNLNGILNPTGIFTGLPAGLYTYLITDATGCMTTGEITVESAALLEAAIITVNVNCFGAANGSITITQAAGGSASYEYSIDNVNWQTDSVFAGLSPGAYQVFIRDANVPACVVLLGSVEITEPLVLSATTIHTNVTLPGANDGSITVTNPSGGSGLYEFSIDGANWQTSGIFANLAPGTYTVLIRDASAPDCIITIGIEIILDGLSVTMVVVPVSCYGYHDGTATAVATGGTEPYSYLWNDPAAQTTPTAFNLSAGIYSVTVTDSVGTTVIVTDTITQPEEVIPVFAPIAALCQNTIPPALPDTSLNGISGSWLPENINTAVAGIFDFVFTPDTTECASLTTIQVEIIPELVPVFDSIAPICQNTSAPVLPVVSLNGIPGTWNPPAINTSVAGMASYTFTADSGICSSQVTIEVEIMPELLPAFAPVSTLCLNSVASVLPDTSLNGVSGTWNPPVVSTSAAGIFNFKFSPDEGECAVSTIIQIEVTDTIHPLFDPIGPLCLNSIPPQLPGVSLNNITGSWTPDTISTAVIGISLYTFTPDSNQCSANTTMAIEVTGEITPVFNPIGPLCVNSEPPALPSTSLNGITGSWIPPVIITSSPGTYIYTFTPDTGQCAVPVTMAVQVRYPALPLFTPIGPLCQFSVPPALPYTSNNGISGNWEPPLINTSVSGTTLYVFTPDPGLCATSTSMNIEVYDRIVPSLGGIGPLCEGSVPPALPDSSLNGIPGTWNPATINTSVPGITICTFNPAAGQCADTVQMEIEIQERATPLFTQAGPFCLNSVPSALPDTSLNGIPGTWDPELINTSVTGTTIYTFTPDTEQCAEQTTMSIEVVPEIMPLFDSIGSLCLNSIPPELPDSSLNGIAGDWDPPVISTLNPGTGVYTFTPLPGQCAAVVILSIEISEEQIPEFNPVGPLCLNAVPPELPDTSVDGITGTWNPPTIFTSDTGTYNYQFTPDAGQCAAALSIGIRITEGIVPQFAPISPVCRNSIAPPLPGVSLEGITGTWIPDSISTVVPGITRYTFTPDSGQCAVAAVLTVEVGGPEITDVQVFTSTNGLPNGRAWIVASGDTTLLTYSLNDTAWQSSSIFTHLTAGTYTAWIMDANGCKDNRQFVIMNTVVGEVGVFAGDVLSCISIPFEIPVIAYDFTNIAAFTIQLAFDSSVIQFNGLSQVNEQLQEGVLNSTLVSPGILQISYEDPDSMTLFSEDMLFTVEFYGMVSGNTALDWNWLQCVIYSASGYEIPAIYTKGTVEIRPAPPIYVDRDGSYCEGTDLTLNAGSITGQNLQYNWTGPNGTSHHGSPWELVSLDSTDAGEYVVTAYDSTACFSTETLHISVNPGPLVYLAEYDTLCVDDPIVLSPGSGFSSYLWQDESSDIQLVATTEGLYWVMVTDDNGCFGGDSVYLQPCELLLWMPNAFTPNGDGLNDVFEAKTNLSDVGFTFHMSIYNKWGEEIFTSNDIRKGWDGTFKGQLCQEDLYTWTIRFSAPPKYSFVQKSPQRGFVMLLR